MSKRATTFERALPAKASPTPAYRWLYWALRAAILEGRLEQLKSEGYVQARMGPGTYVSETLPDELLQVRSIAKPKQPQQQPRTQPRKISAYPKRVHLFPAFAPRPSRAFRPNLPALDLFPPAVGTGRRGRLRKVSTNFLLGCDPRG
jgi:hypothetical protein